MGEEGLIKNSTRKAIKKMAEISQCAKALSLMPSPEKFALMIIGDFKIIAKRVNNISSRIKELLEKYSTIPTEFLLEGFDVVLEKLENVSDSAKIAISETTDILSSNVSSVKDMTSTLGSALSTITSATLQIGGGSSYSSIAMGSNIKLAIEGNSNRKIVHDVTNEVAKENIPVGDMDEEIKKRVDEVHEKSDDAINAIRDWTTTAAEKSTSAIDGAFKDAEDGIQKSLDWIDEKKEDLNELVDDSVGVLIDKVKDAKKNVEEKIQKVQETFDKLVKDFDESFGFIKGTDVAEGFFDNISENARESDSQVINEIAELSDEVKKFIDGFDIAKTTRAIGGLFIGAGAATLAMDLLPKVDVDRMLKGIIGGINDSIIKRRVKMEEMYYEDKGIDLLEVIDFPWQLSKDDLEKYNADAYNEFIEQYVESNDNERSNIMKKFMDSKTRSDYNAVNKEKMKENKNKSALKALRKVRRGAIKARMVERYKGFLTLELEYLKKEFRYAKESIKNEWDAMMYQYKTSINEIKRFFSEDGCGGNDMIDDCCDRINRDAEEIIELCQNISVELTNTVSMIPTPYSIGTCVDMPVHKILAFFKDVKIILTFLKNLIRLSIDIVVQISKLTKIIANGMKSISEIMKELKRIIGIDEILKMIDSIIALFRQKMIDGKILLENTLSPIYYNETDDYEMRVEALEALLEDDVDGGNVEEFRYTDDIYAKKKHMKVFGGNVKDDDEIEDILEELESKGEREIVAYRSPILNESGDDFAGWIFYHAYAYDNMKKSWSSSKKRRRNKLIKKASKKNKMRQGRLAGGVYQLKKNKRFGYYSERDYIKNSVTGYEAYYWYTKWTNDPTDCEVDMTNKGEDIVVPIQTTSNGSLVELSDGRRVFVDGKIVQSGDFVNVDGVKYRVK